MMDKMSVDVLVDVQVAGPARPLVVLVGVAHFVPETHRLWTQSGV